MRLLCFGMVLVLAGFGGGSFCHGQERPKMKFNEVRELAPGVFFRYSSISATDPKVPFGGCNNIWIVFEEYVLVFDANFPKEAGDVLQAIRKTTDKPIRYVVDSHHHGDHAYGNSIWAKEGASIIAQRNCFEWLRGKGRQEFLDAGKGPAGRKDIAATKLKVPDLVFDEKLILDDGKQRVEIYAAGHCHTPGDAVLYLPKYKMLCTGDACVNGAFNYTGHSNTATWVENLDRLARFDVKMILPGHGLPTGRELLTKQRNYFAQLRAHVRKGIKDSLDVEEITKTLDLPWYREWTGVPAKDRVENIKHVHAEMTGTTLAWEFVEDYRIYEAKAEEKPGKDFLKPKKIVVPNLMPARLQELKRIAPDVLFVPVKNAEEAAQEAAGADAVLGFLTKEILKNGNKLRWIQVRDQDLAPDLIKEIPSEKIALTCLDHISGVDNAEQALTLLLDLNRRRLPRNTPFGKKSVKKTARQPHQLHGKNMLILGMGAVGKQIASRARAFGMKVELVEIPFSSKAEEAKSPEISRFANQLPRADVVVLAGLVGGNTKGLAGKQMFAKMKPSAFLICVGRREVIQFGDLVSALEKQKIGGAGLHFTDGEIGFTGTVPNLLLSDFSNQLSPEARERQWRFWKENIRRFTQGEPLLCVLR